MLLRRKTVRVTLPVVIIVFLSESVQCEGRSHPPLIYAFIYREGQQAEQLWRYLTRSHKRLFRNE
jgi:hypothetical protein